MTRATVIVFDHQEFDALLQIEPQLRPRLERSAALLAAISRPTFEPWYQVVEPGPANSIAAALR